VTLGVPLRDAAPASEPAAAPVTEVQPAGAPAPVAA
jgi:hypothetical protein